MKKYVLLLTALTLVAANASAQQANVSSENGVAPGLTPASPLYGIEMFVEDLEVKIAGMIGGSDMKAKALANNAEERVSEARSLIDKNQSEEATKAIERYSKTLNQSIGLANRGQDDILKQKINNISSKNVETLKQVKEKVPDQAKPAIENAINQSERRRGPPENALNKSERSDQKVSPGSGNPVKEVGPNNPVAKPDSARNKSRDGSQIIRNNTQDIENRSNLDDENRESGDKKVKPSSGEEPSVGGYKIRKNKIAENNSLADPR